MTSPSADSEQAGAGVRAPARRESGRKRRQLILDSTLQLIASQGIRAVRHRAVAAHAGVPLAATTYYFQDITHLLKEAFVHYAGRKDGEAEVFRREMAALALQLQRSGTCAAAASDDLALRLTRYIASQAADREGRVIELAFKNEAQRDPALAALIAAQDRRFCLDIAAVLRHLGSAEPELDAQITLSLILRMEAELAFGELTASDVKRVVSRHVAQLWASPPGPM